MHIEPGVVTGAKVLLGVATGAGVLGMAVRHARDELRRRGFPSLLARTLTATACVFTFFEVLPHQPLGVSEVHFVFGTSLLLVFGLAPAALGLALGLLVQGLFFAPWDLPQYGMNVTSLLAPLYVTAAVARRTLPPDRPYVELRYRDVLPLSITYQGGMVAWIAFWSIWGQGAAALPGLVLFASGYIVVIVVEPLVDLGLLALAKRLQGRIPAALVTPRLYAARAAEGFSS